MHWYLVIKKGTNVKWIGYWMNWWKEIIELCWKDGKKGRMEENEREIEWFWNEDELNGMDVIEL